MSRPATSHVAYVITYIIGNSSGVTGIILRNVGLNFSHDIGTYVGSLRVDTTTHTGEECLCRSTHTEGQHGGGDRDETILIEVVEHDKPDGDVEQSKTYHSESHDGTRAEGNLQTSVQALTRSIGRTGGGIGGGLHAEEACQTREETTSEEGKRHPGVLHVQAIGHEGKEGTKHHKDDADHLILLFQVGHSAFAYIERNLFHTGRAFIGCHHLAEEEPRHAQCHERCYGLIIQKGFKVIVNEIIGYSST